MEWTIHDVRAAHLAFLAGAVLVLPAGAWLARRLPRPWKIAAWAATLFLAVRLVALDNPWAWQAYVDRLRGGSVGWRHMDVIRQKMRSYLKEKPVRYLAVGTSQTGMVYNGLAAERADVGVVSLAGMYPLDLALYRDRIAAYRPRCILLYVGEWDLAQRPEPEHLPLAPPQRLRLFGIARRVLALPGGRAYRRAFVEAAVGEVFPEFKYGFVFRTLLNETIRGTAGVNPPQKRLPALSERDEAWFARDVQAMGKRLSADALPFHEFFLRAFLDEARERGIRVVLVEGQLMPRIVRGKVAALAAETSRVLRRIAADHPEVIFLPVESQPPLVDGDFLDLTHVRAEVGLRFSRAIVDHLDALGVADGRMVRREPRTRPDDLVDDFQEPGSSSP